MVAKLGKKRHIFREKNLLNEMDNQFIIKLLGTTMVSLSTLTSKIKSNLTLVTFRMSQTSTSFSRTALMVILPTFLKRDVSTCFSLQLTTHTEKLDIRVVRAYAA